VEAGKFFLIKEEEYGSSKHEQGKIPGGNLPSRMRKGVSRREKECLNSRTQGKKSHRSSAFSKMGTKLREREEIGNAGVRLNIGGENGKKPGNGFGQFFW